MNNHKNKKIYIADDELNIREAIKTFLENEGFLVETFENGDLLFEKFKKEIADLIVLDVMMPGSNGFNICIELRKISTVPIIMLTARDTDLDYATGLSLGSDDYLTKPFSPMSLVMKIKAIFRRIEYDKDENAHKAEVGELNFADISIDLNTKIVKLNNKVLELSPNEYNLLSFLIKNKDKAVSREEILNSVWDFNCEVETRAIDDTIRRLRKKISKSEVTIDTVWGYGFRLLIQQKKNKKEGKINVKEQPKH